MINQALLNIVSGNFSKEDIKYLLTHDEASELYASADRIRKEYVGDEVHIREIIEISNYCKQHCLYCGIQAQNKNVVRYRMDPDEIIERVRWSLPLGYRSVVLQSGEDDAWDDETVCRMIREIKAMDISLTLSFGEKSRETFKKYREAGADRYLLKHETSDEKLYEYLDPGMTFANRIKCQKDLKELGFQVGSGIMVGLPGQTIGSIADDIMLFFSMDYDMIGISPFIPHGDTIIGAAKKGDPALVRKTVAITRILLKDIHLPVTTAYSTLSDFEGKLEMLSSGANVIMPNITPMEYRDKYVIYPDKDSKDIEPFEYKRKLEALLKRSGRTIGTTYGHRINK